jgi:hypothetical protein
MLTARERANALVSVGNFPAAFCEFEEHLAAFPADIRACYEYACALSEARRYKESWQQATNCIRLDKSHGEAFCLLANLCGCLGYVEENEAEQYFKKSLKVSPGSPLTHWNYALWELSQGRWRSGWERYEWGVSAGTRPVRTKQPQWAGKALGSDSSLFLWAEQGFGDTIMCLQLLRRVREQNPECRIVLEVPKELVRFVQQSCVAEEVFETRTDKSVPFPFDAHCSLMSLPHVLGIEPDTLNALNRYLCADEDGVNKWAAQIDPYAFNVGIVWAGSPNHAGNAERSLSLEQFAPLFQMNATFYSFQKDVSAEEIAAGTERVIPLGDGFQDFADTAAVLVLMDLVITCDTSVAHLAGALGKQVWNLISANPDYRWMQDTTETPFYPSMRLYRQERLGEWGSVIDRVKADLEECLQCLQP